MIVIIIISRSGAIEYNNNIIQHALYRTTMTVSVARAKTVPARTWAVASFLPVYFFRRFHYICFVSERQRERERGNIIPRRDRD